MITCNIDIRNNFLSLGIKHILIKEENKINLSILNSNRLNLDVIFIDYQDGDINKLISNLKGAYIIFIFFAQKDITHSIELEFNDGVTFLLKEDPVHVLTSKIESALSLRKSIRFNESMIDRLEKPITLTCIQQQVIDLVNYGFSGGAIAKILNKSEKTISWHKRKAMKIMGVSSNIELHRLKNFKSLQK